MNKIYKVTLTPLDWFFFGGERTLGEGVTANYLSCSNIFPQQSAIIGLLRYQILKQNNLLTKEGRQFSSEEFERIESLIGNTSFNMKKTNFDYGKINSVSPVFVMHRDDDDICFSAPLDQGISINFENARFVLNGIEKNKITDDQGTFNHKTYNNYLKWVCKKGVVMSEDIWMRKTQIGITKNKSEKDSDERNFYKQEYLFFKDDFVYVFFVTLKDDFELQSDRVYLGGQRSVFQMDVESTNKIYEQDIPDNYKSTSGRIVLLSDTYVADYRRLAQLCDFQWCFAIPFRNIQTSIHKENYNRKPNKSSVKYYFLQRGSVLYFEEDKRTDILSLIRIPYLQSIGYNQYV